MNALSHGVPLPHLLSSERVIQILLFSYSEATDLPRSAVTARARAGIGHIEGWLD